MVDDCMRDTEMAKERKMPPELRNTVCRVFIGSPLSWQLVLFFYACAALYQAQTRIIKNLGNEGERFVIPRDHY